MVESSVVPSVVPSTLPVVGAIYEHVDRRRRGRFFVISSVHAPAGDFVGTVVTVPFRPRKDARRSARVTVIKIPRLLEAKYYRLVPPTSPADVIDGGVGEQPNTIEQ